MKKRGCADLKWDASYKEAKHLAQHHGQGIFKALITGTNTLGEVRVQFHVVTDGHDQMIGQIQALLATLEAYGQPPPLRLATDKPAEDKAFFLEQIPSLAAQQRRLDALDAPDGPETAPPPAAATATGNACTIDLAKLVKVGSTATEINSLCDLVREQAESIVSLDAEWEVTKGAGGHITGRDRVALIQIGYRRRGESESHALLLRVHKMDTLPARLLALLEDERFTMVGRAIKSDLSHVGKDFRVAAVTSQVKIIDLGPFARARDVVVRGTAGLERLVLLTLGDTMSKAPDVRCGKWAAPQLSDAQLSYAALDATKSLDVYHALAEKMDLSARLSAEEAVSDCVIDLVPRHGSVTVMATRAAAGRVVASSGSWSNTLPGGKGMKVTKTRRLIEITKVLAPSFIVPGVKVDGRDACLSDFGAAPFQLVVTLTLLAPHATASQARVWDGVEAAAVGARQPAPPPAHDGPPDGVEDELDRDAEEALDGWQPSAEEVALLRTAAEEQSSSAEATASDGRLGAAPDSINDCYSAVTGDAFHFQDRPKVPMKHEAKKAYHVALRDAWMIFDPVILGEVQDTLRYKGFDEHDISSRMYYDFDYFLQRVPRRVPPPSVHYWRVRRVFELFGPIVDSKTKQPLFNEARRRPGSAPSTCCSRFSTATLPMRLTTPLTTSGSTREASRLLMKMASFCWTAAAAHRTRSARTSRSAPRSARGWRASS